MRVRAYKGNVGSTLLLDLDGVTPGSEVTVSGYAGSPNDVFWEIFEAGTLTKLGESSFHLSCSDQDMNDPSDCGKPQGDGKGGKASTKSAPLLNDWLLEGIVGATSTLDCSGP